MKKLARWINLTIKLQISTLMAWLLVAPPLLAYDGQPGDYLNSTNTSNNGQSQTYQGYTQTQSSNDCGTYAPTGNYQQQSQQNWTPQPAGQPNYYGQVQTQQSVPPQNYNSGYQPPTTSVNMSAWQGAQPTASESNTRNSGQASSAQSDPNSGQTARAMGQVATKVLPVAAAMVGMGIMNKMRTGSMMGYPSYGYGGYGNPYGYGGYGGYGYGGYGGYGGGYGMNPMNMMMNPMSRMGMGGMGMGGMGMNPLNMIRF